MRKPVFFLVVWVCVISSLTVSCAQIRGLVNGDETVSSNAIVDGNGFAVVVDGFTVSAPAGVAAEGSEVVVTSHTSDRFQDTGQFAGRVGSAIEVVLNDGEQPAQPISVAVSLTEDSVPENFAPLAVTDGLDGQVEIVATTYDPASKVLFAKMNHLSFLQFLHVDFGKISSFMGDSTKQFFGFGSADAPDCVGRPVEVGGRTITASRTKNLSGDEKSAAWPCLAVTDGKLELSLESNSNLSWLTYSRPETAPAYSSGSGSADTGAQAIYRQLSSGKERTAGFLTPGGTVRHTFPIGTVPELAGLRSSAALGLTATFLYMLDSVATLFGVKSGIASGAGGYDCIRSAVDTADTSSKSPGESAGSMLKTELDCLSAVATGPLGFFLGVLGGGLGIIVSSITGIYTELSGNAKQLIDFEVEGSAPAPAVGEQHFQSPSRNVRCQMGDSIAGTWGADGIGVPAVGCIAIEYNGPGVGVTCETATLNPWQGAAALGVDGAPGRTLCTGGQPFSKSPSEDFPVLQYGESAEWGRFSCTTDYVVGVICQDSTTGNGFSVSRDNVAITGQDATRYATSGGNDSPMDAELGLFSNTFAVRGIELTLIPDGTGTLYRNSGATDIATWPIVWEHTGTARATIVLGSPNLSSNQPSAVNADFQAGATYNVVIQDSPRVMVIEGPVAGSGRDLPPLCPQDDRSACGE
ncbi:hypothetical protein R4P47_07620 [Rhodococcus sp. IEGM 1370]|uniref:hypothetical protein n=1 Tax=unclassified Rhodococcus (in: high G+C Gram-positive bacteria) TaxID=192944 RepID=UPI0011EE4841|nr:MULTISPECIES: hypothetical protein [unclassified Rhodococcus (in: high G+C Gram-positive bacteria)]KAA0925822.1 hypothetical protein FQ188_09585 [Rhodococcus sp. ANT_H53B]MDV8076424.1 hypothetical protein [Rhodococcus sp. IEGM 1370]